MEQFYSRIKEKLCWFVCVDFCPQWLCIFSVQENAIYKAAWDSETPMTERVSTFGLFHSFGMQPGKTLAKVLTSGHFGIVGDKTGKTEME